MVVGLGRGFQKVQHRHTHKDSDDGKNNRQSKHKREQGADGIVQFFLSSGTDELCDINLAAVGKA